MLVKGQKNSVILPPVKTFQENSICHLVNFPAEMSDIQNEKINQYMQRIDENIEGCGVFAFEFFENEKGELFINEAAPRVHNSYHFSMEVFDRSQFDLMVECALGELIEQVHVQYDHSCMLNLLGQSECSNYHLEFPYLEEGEFKIHLYGKEKTRVGRKMGHITFYGKEDMLDVAKKIKSEYQL